MNAGKREMQAPYMVGSFKGMPYAEVITGMGLNEEDFLIRDISQKGERGAEITSILIAICPERFGEFCDRLDQASGGKFLNKNSGAETVLPTENSLVEVPSVQPACSPSFVRRFKSGLDRLPQKLLNH